MKNENYWANRIKIAQDKTLDRIYDEYVANIEKQYDRAIRDIEKDILSWYQRFADNNELSFADAQKLLKSDDLEEFKWTVQEYIEKGKENGISADWAKELENASARVHISRLESLKYQLRAHAEELTQGRIKNTAEASELAFTEGYYHTAFEFQKEIGVGFSLQSIDRVKLEKILNKPWTIDNQTFTARCWTDKARLVEVVNQELTRMVATGAAPKKAIESIAKQFGTSKSNASKLIMTESAYFATASQGECYKDLGVDDYEVIGTLDKGMCDFCGEMDGKVFPVNKMQAGSTAPPFHPWCRCTTAPWYEDMVGVGQRFARDTDGKTYTVPSDMTYAEWKQKFVDNSAESGIINMYKGNGLSIVSNEEISKSTVKKVEKATKQIMRDFPNLKHYSESVSFGKVVGGHAVNNYDPQTGLNNIILNQDSFSNVEELLRQLDYDYAIGKSYKVKGIESLVAHEMGHNVHIALALKKAGLLYGAPLRGENLIRFNEEYLKIQQEIYMVAFNNETLEEIYETCSKELGSMTVGNANELVAQSFGNYYFGVQQSHIGKSIVDYFKKELK